MPCNDSDTRNITCPVCQQQFDGELPIWESGSEECAHCEAVFTVDAEPGQLRFSTISSSSAVTEMGADVIVIRPRFGGGEIRLHISSEGWVIFDENFNIIKER